MYENEAANKTTKWLFNLDGEKEICKSSMFFLLTDIHFISARAEECNCLHNSWIIWSIMYLHQLFFMNFSHCSFLTSLSLSLSLSLSRSPSCSFSIACLLSIILFSRWSTWKEQPLPVRASAGSHDGRSAQGLHEDIRTRPLSPTSTRLEMWSGKLPRSVDAWLVLA